jgi:putative nucleotidyltransferase with HDIG domain
MSIKPIHWYVGLVVSAALVSLGLQDWHGFVDLPSHALAGVGLLTAIGLVSEGTALRLSVSTGKALSSVTFLPLLACVLLFGPTSAVVFYLINGVIAEFFIRKKGLLRAAFNAAQYVLATAVAGWAFAAVGGEALALEPTLSEVTTFYPHIGAFILFSVVFLLTNQLLVFAAISLADAAPFAEVFASLMRKQVWLIAPELMISPLGLVIASLYVQIGYFGILISLLPLIFVRHSYLSKFKLEQVNHDLLKALVMAIETRDKYTSGHSLRVQRLSERIGRELGLPARKIDELSTAALLHDIGKIEVGYEEILQKPGSLTDEEVRIIQSHVLRGVDILTSFSSSMTPVIEAVRYHHEAWDGTGYPHGIEGEEIPLYARIIGVSDAIDAMLSDRPYRKALTVETVEQELEKFRGRQFDPKIAEVVLSKDLVSEHQREIELSKGLGAFDADAPAFRLRRRQLQPTEF